MNLRTKNVSESNREMINGGYINLSLLYDENSFSTRRK